MYRSREELLVPVEKALCCLFGWVDDAAMRYVGLEAIGRCADDGECLVRVSVVGGLEECVAVDLVGDLVSSALVIGSRMCFGGRGLVVRGL